MSDYQTLKRRLDKHNQEHLLRFWDELGAEERKELAAQIDEIDFSEVFELFKRANETFSEDVEKLDHRMQPIPQSLYESEVRTSPDLFSSYRKEGLRQIAEGHVGVILMAGGQGTRLGVTYPKGMYQIGLPSNKSLFQILAQRILRLQELAEKETGKKGVITWYVMTSLPTIDETLAYFKKFNFFGLNPENIVTFQQGLLPCFDFNGNLILDNKGKIAVAPDGNGGIYNALYKQGVLNDMVKRGVKYVHVHSVDNILTRVADPVFIGYCISKGADCGAKVVQKSSPHEAVGVVCKVDNKFQVVEYSEITEKTAELKDADGSLLFKAGNICNHFFTTTYLQEIAKNHEKQLKLHVAKKKIPYINDKAERIKPQSPNGIKIEKFVFDVFQFTDKFATWEIERQKEFSALKNSDDAKKDCPSTARRDLFSLHKSYIKSAGGIVNGDIVEISPLLSYAGEDLEFVAGQVFESPVNLLSPSEK